MAIGRTPRYVLGVDGGGSKIACLAADGRGRLLGYGRGGPCNTNYAPRAEAQESFTHAAVEALASAGLQGNEIALLCISAPMEPDAIDAVAKMLGIRRVVRAAEGETPRWAARFWIDGRVGVTVDAGTGSLARGWATDGRQASAGGWGTTLGDEGSGYWIALRAMSAVLEARDGRLGETLLTRALLEHLGLTDELDLVFHASQGLVRPEANAGVGVGPDSGVEDAQTAYEDGGLRFQRRVPSQAMTRAEVASLCPIVAKAAGQGDAAASAILYDAGVELGRLAAAVIRRLGMTREAFGVVPFGGVFRIGGPVLGPFQETVRAAAPGANVTMPRFEPVAGAVLMALAETGVGIDAGVLSSLEESATAFREICALERQGSGYSSLSFGADSVGASIHSD